MNKRTSERDEYHYYIDLIKSAKTERDKEKAIDAMMKARCTTCAMRHECKWYFNKEAKFFVGCLGFSAVLSETITTSYGKPVEIPEDIIDWKLRLLKFLANNEY